MELINNLSLLLVSYVAISSVANLFSSVEGRVMYKTIKTEYGSIYDCVDIYKQPAFDHPLLRNHKIQMRPSFALQRMPNNTSSTGTTKYGLKNECPRGTVPIRRMSKEEQLRSDFSFTQELGQSSTGFEVNPDLFGDNRTRLYTIWGQGVDGVMHGCYDTRCPGFVIVSTQIPLNVVFKDISVAGGSQFYVKLSIAQDKATGHWWLLYSEKDDDPDQQIGYWPNTLFTNIKQDAQVIRWGGIVYSDKPISPPMGSGRRDCHYRRIAVAAPGASADVPLETSQSRCYRVGDNSYKDKFWGYSFWFGGLGGDSKHCN
ncbi:hypothetical protein ACOSQ2_009895 [Xanthoceras sorbifolium]